MRAYLSLGSNEGDRNFYLHKALCELVKTDQIQLSNTSSIYETEPVGFNNQAWFLNAVVVITTKLMPFELLAVTKGIEKRMGREECFRWGPRIIDIDILLYGNQIIKSDTLTIPHPEMCVRKFVLFPLAEIVPHYIHPEMKLTIRQLLHQCPDSKIKWFSSFKLKQSESIFGNKIYSY